MNFFDRISYNLFDYTPEEIAFIRLERVIDCSPFDFEEPFYFRLPYQWSNVNSETLKLWRKSHV